MERFYGYGIVNAAGYAITISVDIDIDRGKRRSQETVDRWNTPDSEGGNMPDAPYRVVELFYKDEQS